MKKMTVLLGLTFAAFMVFSLGLFAPSLMAVEGDASPQQNAAASDGTYTSEVPYVNSESGQTTDSATGAESSTGSGVYVDSVSFMMGYNSNSTSSGSDSETSSGSETDTSGLVDGGTSSEYSLAAERGTETNSSELADSNTGTESSTTVESGTDSDTTVDATIAPLVIHTQALAQNMVVTLDDSRDLVSLIGTHVNTGDVYTYEGLHFRVGDSPLGQGERILCNADGKQVIGRIGTVALQGGDRITYTYVADTLEILRTTSGNVRVSRLIKYASGMWVRENYTSGVVASIETSSGARAVQGVNETVVTSAVGGTSDTFISNTNTASLFVHKISSIEVGGNGRIILRTDNPRIYGVYKILPSGNLKFEYVMEQHAAPNENVRVLHGKSLLTTQDGTSDPLATITQTTKESLSYPSDSTDLDSLEAADLVTEMTITAGKALASGPDKEVRIYAGHLDADTLLDYPAKDLLRHDYITTNDRPLMRQMYDSAGHMTHEKVFSPVGLSAASDLSTERYRVRNLVNTYNEDGTLNVTTIDHVSGFNDSVEPLPTDQVHERIDRFYESGRLAREQRTTLADERVVLYGVKETTVFYTYDDSGKLSSKAVYEGLLSARNASRLLVTTNYVKEMHDIGRWSWEIETDVYPNRLPEEQPVPMRRLYDENHRLVKEVGYHDQVSGENTPTTSFMLYDEAGDLTQIKIYDGDVDGETAPQGATPPVLLIENYKKYQLGKVALNYTERYISGALDSKTYYEITLLFDVNDKRIPAKTFQIMKANGTQGRMHDLLVVYEYSASSGALSQNAIPSEAWAQASTNATITVYSDPAEAWETGEVLLEIYKNPTTAETNKAWLDTHGYKQQRYSPANQLKPSMFYTYSAQTFSQTTAPIGAELWYIQQYGYSGTVPTGWNYSTNVRNGYMVRFNMDGSYVYYGDDMNRSSQVPGTYTGGSYLSTTVVVTSNLYGSPAPALAGNDYQYFVNGARPGEIMTVTYQGGMTVLPA